MIDSTSPSDRIHRTENPFPSHHKNPVNRTGGDVFSADNAAVLREALAASPEIRPEVVARGQELAADPNYPSIEILRRIGAVLLDSPDLTAEEA